MLADVQMPFMRGIKRAAEQSGHDHAGTLNLGNDAIRCTGKTSVLSI